MSVSSVVSSILNVVLAFVILMIMVTIHESGHYTAGKLLKFKINEFSVGMGPKIISHKKKDGQLVSLRALPLGGYCAFEGEDYEEGAQPVEGAFDKQAPWKRLIVLFSGAFFNFLSALVVCAILFASYGETVALVGKSFDYAPEAVRSLNPNDIIYEVNGHKVYLIDSLSRYLAADELTVTVLRYDDGYNCKKRQVYQHLRKCLQRQRHCARRGQRTDCAPYKGRDGLSDKRQSVKYRGRIQKHCCCPFRRGNGKRNFLRIRSGI